MKNPKTAAVIVAHPDDETLWAGGTILCHPSWKWLIVCVSRSSDSDRSARFYKAIKALLSNGVMGDLDDGPEQRPMKNEEVERCILQLLPPIHYDLIISHNPTGEYTRHLLHEEISRAVITLWQAGKIMTDELWTFAYEDGSKKYLPRPMQSATLFGMLPEKIWQKKYGIITNHYGFKADSWEAETTPKGESFWQFKHSDDAMHWLIDGGKV